MKNEHGRSMIEMLGVLAIIGVLSVAGLAGYTMAINRHRANTALDYARRALIAVQSTGNGSSQVEETNCQNPIMLGEQRPSTLVGCKVSRTNDGASTVIITFGDANTASAAFAQTVGITLEPANRTYEITDQGDNANKWVAGTNPVGE